jgi:hypothetical protein
VIKEPETIDPDVEKAKKQDLLKLQKPLTAQPQIKAMVPSPKPINNRPTV